ncbi:MULTISPECIES: acetolactate synthase small subunit [Staphylococcus]|uniref:Acetolactate synthase small subunit n=1 Tax=Staphylococcus chromogenes TaxID=46126 RepID=A0AAE5W8A9_STACR|nr:MULTISPECIES: acetolactate synthase small subunit [Staphylococcus]KDP12419.1 acetolactate synthase small subunit [Staphylococcus chromogenes MU 970]MBP0046532.1 acetolactate synthase small subunit [Staphylococcus chromogenes]MBV5138888.1 acetolactate synthase small subunit [Staphylococcus chromogenes]MBV5191841.1 acetolactate synthase small subunit [Staphylococcus chromogenes]MBW3133361.1 acetolactate synthase small subunit [Staphylococcus chromogenes]
MRRTFKLKVFDKVGTLNRLTSLFVRRQFNIVNISASPTREEGLTEITFVAEVPNEKVTRTIIQQLKKQINTLLVEDITETNTFNRELLLIKLKVPEDKMAFEKTLHSYDALVSILKEDDHAMYLQAIGPQLMLDQLLNELSSLELEQVSRTGTANIV